MKRRYDKIMFMILALLGGLIIFTSCSDMEKDFETKLVEYAEITVTDFSPKTGRPTVPVTITGTNFGDHSEAAIITFNGVEADDIISYSDTEMVVAVPEDAGTGPVTVKVWTHTKTTSENFEFIPGSKISEISAERGQAGDTVTITGSNFGADANGVTISIGGVEAEIVSVSNTEIKFLVPDADSGSLILNVEGQVIEGPYFLVGGELITGGLIGHEGSWGNNPATEITAAVDGDMNTFVDGPSATGYVGYDVGAGKAVSLTSARFVPRTSHPQRMVGGEIRGANDPTFIDAVTLHTITEEPPTEEYTEVSIDTEETYRYIYYYSADGYCNISEVEFYGNIVDANTPEGKYIFEFDDPSVDFWLPQQDASWVVEDGQLKVTFNPSQFDGTNKRRADLKYDLNNKGNWVYTSEYPIIAMKMTNKPAQGNLRWDVPDIGSFGNNDYNKDFEAQDVIYWDFSEKTTDDRVETDWVVQLKIADITSDETGYEVHWIRTFKNVDELNAFVNR